MSSSDSYYIEILKNIFVYLYRYVIPIFYIMGNIGNLLSVLIFAKKSWRKNVCVFYFNICLLVNTLYINSTILTSIFNSGFQINFQNKNLIVCKLYFYVAYLFSTLMPTILILASIDRLLISSQNVDTRLYSSKRLAYFSVSLSTIFWCIFYFHVLIKVNLQEISPSSIVCYYDSTQYYRYFVSFSTFIITCLFCLSMIILCIFAFKNVQRIRSIPRQQQKQIRTMTKKDFQLLRCLFAQDIVYIMFSVCVSIMSVYQVATASRIRTPLQRAIVDFCNNFSNFIHHIPACASFYIFICVSKAFRNELKRMVYNIFGKHIAPLREEENPIP